MDSKQLIAEYDYKTKHFLLYSDGGSNKQKVYVQYYDLNNINQVSSDVSQEELLIASRVLQNITISSDFSAHIDIGTTIHHEKKFQMFLDPVSHLRYFYEIKDNAYSHPDKSDLEYLNNTFNNEHLTQDESITVAQEYSEQLPKKMRRHVKLGSVILTVFLTLDTIFLTSPTYLVSENSVVDLSQDFNVEKEELQTHLDRYNLHSKFKINEVTGNVNATDTLISSINNNQMLSVAEKEFITTNKDVFNENALYIDLPSVDQKFSNLGINYVSNVDEVNDYNLDVNNTAGFYVPSENMIYMMPNFHDSKEVLYHEFMHSFGTIQSPFGFALSEAINETMSIEYFPSDKKEWSSYQNPRTYLKMLTEIVGPDLFKEFKFKSDIDIVINKLNTVIDNPQMAYSLIGAIDDCQIYSDYIMRSSNSDLLDEMILNYQNSSTAALDIIGQYFEKHTGYEMENDLIMSLYASEIKKVGADFESTNLDVTLPTLVQDKGYFSKKYIEQNPHHVVKYSEKEFIDVSLEVAINSSLVNLTDELVTRTIEVPDIVVNYVLPDGLSLTDNHVSGYINNEKYIDIPLEEAIDSELVGVEEECIGMKLEETDEEFGSTLIINNDLVLVGVNVEAVDETNNIDLSLEEAIEDELVVVEYSNNEIKEPKYPNDLASIYKQFFIKEGFKLTGGKVVGMHENKKYVKLTEENRRIDEPFENKNHMR